MRFGGQMLCVKAAMIEYFVGATKNHPLTIAANRWFEWVAKGARTLDLQSHNLALYPTEL
jgi:hypothetical protein